jgi:hypothetical protein
MRILAVTTGLYGDRIVTNIKANLPEGWHVSEWRAPSSYPIVIDDPADYLPPEFERADLVLALGEHPGVAELIPDICKLSGAHAVIAPIDRNEWLPKGLANQLKGWLAEMEVDSVFPKPFCALTEDWYSLRRQKVTYSNAVIGEFARHFGLPRFSAQVQEGKIEHVDVLRHSPCGCSRFVADGLTAVPLADVEFGAGMLHHHYPCLAAMGIDPDYSDTLMHVSGNLTVDAVVEAIKPFRQNAYLKPR